MFLNLNYSPEVVVDTTTLTEKEWLEYRRLGIGGSDVAAIMGQSCILQRCYTHVVIVGVIIQHRFGYS